MTMGRESNATAGVGTLLVIAKTPEPGRVKTRLCPPCTPQQAAAVASAALQDTFTSVAAAGVARRVVALDGEAGPWIPPDHEVIGQVNGGLGERLDAAFRWLARTETTESPMIVVGMDTPQLTGSDLDAALSALGEPGVDAVLGPALDGGYWTIGFAPGVVAGSPGLFEEVPMSTERTAREQMARLRSLGLTCRILDSRRDIDTWTDAVTIAQRFPDLVTSRAVAEVLAGDSEARGVMADGAPVER